MRLFFLDTVLIGVLVAGIQAVTPSPTKCEHRLTQFRQFEVFQQILQAYIATNDQMMPLLESKLDQCMLQKGVDIYDESVSQQPRPASADNYRNAKADVLDDDVCDFYYAFWVSHVEYMASFSDVMKHGLLEMHRKVDTVCEVCPCNTPQIKEVVAAIGMMKNDFEAAVNAFGDLKESFNDTTKGRDVTDMGYGTGRVENTSLPRMVAKL